MGPKFAQIYGQGEAPMTITSLAKALHAERARPRWREVMGSVGLPRTNVEVRIADAEDAALPAGEIGEVLARGDVVMPGYWRDEAASAATLRGGWLHTGDVGALDGEGFLTLKDRSKDLIIIRRQQYLSARSRRGAAAASRRARSLGDRPRPPRLGRRSRRLRGGAAATHSGRGGSRQAVP